jgi:hypothetical protein
MNDRLPTDLYVSAHIRIAAREGVPMTVVHRGDPTSGSIILKINRLDGMSRVLCQVRYDDELVWTPATREDFMKDADAEAYLGKQTAIDPDVWLLEIEDKQARHWFPGRIVRL